jgi:hypothetical protein
VIGPQNGDSFSQFGWIVKRRRETRHTGTCKGALLRHRDHAERHLTSNVPFDGLAR